MLFIRNSMINNSNLGFCPNMSYTGPLCAPLKENRKFKKKIEKGVPSVCFLCLSVCVCECVRGLQATVFGLGCWFLAWRILRWTIRNAFFLFFKILRFDLLKEKSFKFLSHDIKLYLKVKDFFCQFQRQFSLKLKKHFFENRFSWIP